jgi:hypothetical protein
MQFIVLASFLATVSAFAPVPKTVARASVALNNADVAMPEVETEALPPPPAPKVALPAKWFPFAGVKAPLVLDDSLAADAGFDPLGLADSKKTLYWMREAEVKHARLAMLAAVGWYVPDMFLSCQPPISLG